MDDNKISILMPVYNVEKYVDEAIESILNQTYKNFELIIVDDCSKDETYQHIKRYAEIDERIKIYKNEENLKICKTLNKALSKASGKYIARMDGDDISMPNRLEVLMKYLINHPDISLVGSYLTGIDENGKEFNHKRYPVSDKYIKMSNKYISSIPHFWLTYKSVYDQLDGYRDIPYAEDYDLLLRGEFLGLKYANVDEYLYLYRLRQGNTVSANGLVQRKTVEYVQKLHKCESANVNMFNFEEYNKNIYCSAEEKEKYSKSAVVLNEAVHSSNIIRKAILLLKSCIKSKYVFKYILTAIYMRIVLFKEDRKKHK